MDSENKIENEDGWKDEVLTMQDILQQEEDQEADFQAVLGGSDSKCCTYAKGYIKRQALYSCLTCTPEARENPEKRTGICLACSYKCHENHEMIELYTKRNFRCDCGTKRMPGVRCDLDPLKLEENTENLYNQNFSGLYCICHRPYPDPDETIEDQMIQCVMCEDWYHARHLNVAVPSETDFSEMICGECSDKNDFLQYYREYQCFGSDGENDKNSEEKVDVETVDEAGKHKSVLDENDCPESKKPKLDEQACCRPKLSDVKCDKKGAATFWTNDWRKFLCKCEKCLDDYKAKKVEFIIDLEDTCMHYEEKGKNNKDQETSYDKGMRLLSNMNRVSQVEVLVGYNHMRDRLKDFFQEFVTNQQVVKEDDVKRFFSQLKSEKDEVNIPNSCR